MIVMFRTDASLQIGSGHVMRCLTLADDLRQQKSEVIFVCRELPGNLIKMIEGKGYQVVRLPKVEVIYDETLPADIAHAAWLTCSWEQDVSDTIAAMKNIRPDWLIVDHYALDYRWEEKLRPHVSKILVIDDLADRQHECDLLLDQNFYANMKSRYDNLVPASCRKLLGPKYVQLRPEFDVARRALRVRDGQIRRIFVFFGGVDPTNETLKALHALELITPREFNVDVVVGAANPHQNKIQEFCASHERFHYYCQVNNMAELMAAADLAIGAGGTATWERCFLGLPSIVLVLAENQKQAADDLSNLGAIFSLGDARNVASEHIADAVTMLARKQKLLGLSRHAAALFDGRCDVSSLLLKGNANA